MSPFYFLVLLLSSSAFYLVDAQLWWVFQLVFQLGVCAAGLFISSWRLLSLVCLALILFFNLEWLTPNDAPPPACRQRIDRLSGVSKHDSFRLYSALDSLRKEKGSVFGLKLIKVEMNCQGKLSSWPNAEILISGSAKTGGKWFLAGERLEFKNVRLLKADAWSLTMKSGKRFRIYNLSRQKRILGRGSLLLYIQAKARYYLDEFPLTLFKSLATADRRYLRKDAKEKIKRLGIAHIFAISGMHIGILYLGISFIFRLLSSFSLGAIRKGYGVIVIDIVVLGLIFAFLKIIYMPVSAERAFIMLVWWVASRHFAPWQPLSFVFSGTALLILLSRPLAMAQLSFQLSFLSVAGIILIMPLLPVARLQDSLIVSFLKIAVSLAAISLWLSLFTFPLIQRIYPYYSVVSALNNIVHILYLGYVFLPLALLALIHSSASYIFGDLIGEFHLYSLVNFMGRIWERLLNMNAEWNETWIWRADVELDMASMAAYWIALSLIARAAVFVFAGRQGGWRKRAGAFSGFVSKFLSDMKKGRSR